MSNTYKFRQTIQLEVERTVEITIEAETEAKALDLLNIGEYEGDQEETVYEADGDIIEMTERTLEKERMKELDDLLICFENKLIEKFGLQK